MDLTNLIAHWRMEESGPLAPRVDAHATYDLSSFSSPPSDTGVLDLAADLDGVADYLFSSDNIFRTGDIDFAITGWFKYDTIANNKAIFYLGGTLTTTIAYKVYTDASNNLVFAVSVDGSSIAATVTSAITLSTGTWYFFAAWHDSSGNLIGISVNNETAVTQAHSGGVYSAGDTLYLGFNLASTSYSDVKLDSFSFWKRLLTSDERTQLYNSGAGLDYPFVTPSAPFTIADVIDRPTATPVILAEITAGLWCRAWVVDGTFTNTYKVSTSIEVYQVRWNRDTLLTERASAALVDANAGSWYWDGTQLWVRPLTGSIFDATIQAILIFRFSNVEKVLDDLYWYPRIDTAPSLSKRIEAVFGDVGQIGGGNLRLHNTDQYFNSLQTLQWHAGTVTLKLGIDIPGEEMEWDSYETIAVWTVEDWSRDESSFSLRVIEPKAKIKTKLPFTFFNTDDYPAIEQELVGKPVPIAYGVIYGAKPILIDGATKTFLVAGHEIRRFNAVRFRLSREETRSVTTAAADWLLHSSDTYKYYLAGWDIKNVTSNGDSLTEQNSIDDVVANNGSWYAEADYVYVNPQGGETISSETYVINAATTRESWETANFASTDAANGQFTLGDDWETDTEVSVDFEGKPNADDTLMANAVDIIQDLLATVGETNLDTASFTEAASRLEIGMDINGNPIVVRAPSVYITSATEVLEVIGDILAISGGYLFTDDTGQYSIGITEPLQGDDATRITDTEILDFSEGHETQNVITKQIVKFSQREQEADSQVHEENREDLQHINNQSEPVIRESPVSLYDEDHAEYYAQRSLILEGQPIRKFQIKTAWSQFLRNPGDQVLLQSDGRDVDEVLEVLEVRTDLGSKTVTLTLGNLRGFEDACGHWVANADVLPTRFSNLTGYGAGSLVWNSNWDSEIKTWARQNVGYWTDANGFADPDDAESFIPSSWF